MKYIRSLNEISYKDLALVGGKAASLGEMIQAGFPVPPGFVITTNAYKKTTKQLEKEILQAFDIFRIARVAVRSSAITEDSQNASWAGQLESFLNVSKEGLLEAFTKCQKSFASERAISYAKQQKLPKSKRAVAVIVQKMVNSDRAGVMFTSNPVTKSTDELMIEAAYGLGELLVQGEIIPDNYILDKKTLRLNNSVLGSQKLMLTYQNGSNLRSPVSKHLQGKQILNEKQIKTLAGLGIQIEYHYNSPQDIEWAIEKEAFFILQSRPITTI